MLETVTLVFIISGLVISAASGLLGQSLPTQSVPAQTWNLPQGREVKDSGPRTYRFDVDYNMANTKGEVQFRQHLTGEYTRGLPAVRHTGPGFDLAAICAGHGLDNLMERLNALYGARARLNVLRRDGCSVVEMVLPRT